MGFYRFMNHIPILKTNGVVVGNSDITHTSKNCIYVVELLKYDGLSCVSCNSASCPFFGMTYSLFIFNCYLLEVKILNFY